MIGKIFPMKKLGQFVKNYPLINLLYNIATLAGQALDYSTVSK